MACLSHTGFDGLMFLADVGLVVLMPTRRTARREDSTESHNARIPHALKKHFLNGGPKLRVTQAIDEWVE